jgi:hypothetical protein
MMIGVPVCLAICTTLAAACRKAASALAVIELSVGSGMGSIFPVRLDYLVELGLMHPDDSFDTVGDRARRQL